MIRLYLNLSLPFLCLFTALVVIIHAQPNDDHALRALLTPTDCEMPCFMGIRPGVTTVDEAVKLLQANQWVAAVEQDGSWDVRWTWSGLQPAFIQGSKASNLIVSTESQRVSRIVLNTTITLGDVWLILGAPEGHELGYMATDRTGIFYSLRYEYQQVLAAGYGQVCAPVMIFWNPITELDIGLPRPFVEAESNSFSRDVNNLKELLC